MHSAHVTADVLDQFIQAGLPESEALSLQRHIELCSECRCRKEVLEFWAEMAPNSANSTT